MAFPLLSLQTWSERSLLGRPSILRAFVGSIPSRIHVNLFTAAAQALPTSKQPRPLRESVVLLVHTWPLETFCVRELLPHAPILLSAGGDIPLSQLLLQALLTLQPHCNMRVADFSGVYVAGLFQLPLLALPKHVATPEVILQEIHSKCKLFMPDDFEDNLEYFLPWKLQEMREKRMHCTFEAIDRPPLQIHADCQLNLTDWVSMMIDEMTALILQHHTSYRMVIRKLTVEGFRVQDTAHLRWLLSMLDPEMLTGLIIYGKRQAIERVIWEFRDALPSFLRIEQFSLGTSGPRVHLPEENRVPSSQQLLQCYASVLSALPELHELYFIGLGLRHQLYGLLKDIQKPLSKLCLHACDLSREDIEHFVNTKHCSWNLSELGLQFNKLSGMAGEICEIILRSKLMKLDLRETLLIFEEKVHIMGALGTSQLETLCMYENEDMLTVSEYQHIVELACAVPNLCKFYIFPFNFKPFEILIRKKLEPACEEIMSLNGRTDIILQY